MRPYGNGASSSVSLLLTKFGIDLKLDTTGNRLEYDFIVAPAAEPYAIRLAFKGANGLKIDAQGNLRIDTPSGEVKHLKPSVYQEIWAVRSAV